MTVGYEPEPIRIEASQKGWLLVRALAGLLEAITHILAPHGRQVDRPNHDWGAYDMAKSNVLRALDLFERWYGR